MDLTELKASIRAVLLSLGKTATEQEFRKTYYEIEGESFNEVLRKFKLNFYDLFLKMPDVAKVLCANNMVFVQRVSNEETSHMDHLTVNKYTKKYRGPKLVAKSGALKIPVRPFRANPYSYNINSRPSNAYNRYNTKTSQPNANIKVSVNRDGSSRNSQFVKSYGNNSSASSSSKYGSSGTVLKPYYPRYSKTTSTIKNYSTTPTSSYYGSYQNNFTAPKTPASSQIKSPGQVTSARSPRKGLSIGAHNNALIDWENMSCATQYKSTNPSVDSFKNDNTTSSCIGNNQNNFTASKMSNISPIRYPEMAANSLKKESAVTKDVPVTNQFSSSLADWDKNSYTTSKPSETAQYNGTCSTSYFCAPNKIIIDVKEDSKVGPAKPKPVASSSKLIPPNVLKEKNIVSKSVLESSKDPVDSIINKIGDLKIEDFEQKNEPSMISEELNREKDASPSNKENSSSLPILNSDLAKERFRCLRSIKNILFENKAKDERKKVSNVSTFSKVINSIVTLPPVIFDENNRLFEVKILDVLAPSKFTFQFSLDKLAELTKKMDQFYNNLQDIENYKIDELDIKNIVAIRHSNSWYRGQIISVDHSGVFVQYVDALKIAPACVSPKDIFHLHQNFTTESPKSAFGRIHGLKSNDGVNWNILCASKMIDYQQKDVLAIFKSVEDQVFALSIVDEMGDFKRMIDVLIEDDLAEIDPSDFTDKHLPQLSLQD